MTDKLVHAPLIFSEDQIRSWANEIVNDSMGPLSQRPPVTLANTEEWADYANNHHFVPLSADGVPNGYTLDFNWRAEESARLPLPSAEVTETGEFKLWWEYCNYYELNEPQCRDVISFSFKHEKIHYGQWQRIALSVLTLLGHTPNQDAVPITISDLNQFAGAKAAFMRTWTDVENYQCREVEAYTTQISNGDISTQQSEEQALKADLNRVYFYAHGNDGVSGCAGSKWAQDFSSSLERAARLFKEYHIQPSSPALQTQ